MHLIISHCVGRLSELFQLKQEVSDYDREVIYFFWYLVYLK